MTDVLASPERDILIGGQAFTLGGSFGTLRAIQQAFGEDILSVQGRVISMRVDELARLIACASGNPKAEDMIGELLLDEVDITGTDYQILKAELMAHLAVAMTPRRDREKKSRGDGGSDRQAEGFPWADYQRLCLGVLRWPPQAFWASNAWEVNYAWEGYAKSKGIHPEGDYMTREELEEMKRKFPDRHHG